MIAIALKAWSFLKSPIGRWVCVAILVAGMLFAVRAEGYRAGEGAERAAQAKRVAKAVQHVAKVEKAGTAITAAAETKTTARQVEIRTITQTLIKEVPVYVTVEADRRVVLPAGFVRLHDQAATGLPAVPAPTGFVPDAPSGVALSAATETIVSNYGTAYAWREAAIACRSWVSEQAALYDKTIKAPDPTP